MCRGRFPQRMKKEPNEPHFCGYEGKQTRFWQVLNGVGQDGTVPCLRSTGRSAAGGCL